MKAPETQNNTTHLVDHARENCSASDLTPHAIIKMNAVDQEHLRPKDNLSPSVQITTDSHRNPTDNRIEHLNDHDTNNDILEYGDDTRNILPVKSSEVNCNHSRNESDRINEGWCNDSGSSGMRRHPPVLVPPLLPIANPSMLHKEQKLLSHIHNHRHLHVTSVNTDSSQLHRSEAVQKEGFPETGEANRRTGSGEKRVRLYDESSLIDNNFFSRELSEKRRRLTNKADTRLVSSGSSVHVSPNHVSAVPRPLSVSPPATMIATSARFCRPTPLLLPPPISHPFETPFMLPILTPITRPSPKTSYISPSFNLVHQHCRVTARQPSVDAPLTSTSLCRIYGASQIFNSERASNRNKVDLYHPTRTILCGSKSVTPSVLKDPNSSGNIDNHEHEQNINDIMENDNNEGTAKDATVQAVNESHYSKSALLDLIRKQIDIEKERLSTENELYSMTKQFISRTEKRIKTDLRDIEMEEKHLKRKRKEERRRLKMEERNLIRMYEVKKHDIRRKQELESEKLEREHDRLAQLAEDRCTRREIDRRQMELDYDFHRKALAEYYQETEAARRSLAEIHKSRTQYPATSKLDNLWRMFMSRNTETGK